MIDIKPRPLLIVVSAPSGAGKTTLCERLLADHPEVSYSISCTTRAPREGEVDGKSYHFLTEQEFLLKVEGEEFLEYAQVYGHWYGTLRHTVETMLHSGQNALMDVDVQGAATIRDYVARLDSASPLRRGFVDIFIAAPSYHELERRITVRGKDAPEVIKRRMLEAHSEMTHSPKYRYLVVNDDLDRAYRALESIVIAERHRQHV